MDNLLKCDILALLFCLHIETPAYSSICILLNLNWNFELTLNSKSPTICANALSSVLTNSRGLFFYRPPLPRSVKCFYHSLD